MILIGQNEVYTASYPSIAAREIRKKKSLRKNFLVGDAKVVDEVLSKYFPSQYVSIYNRDTVPNVDQNRPYMFDDNHFSKYGADLAVKKILQSAIAVRFFSLVPAVKAKS